MNLGEEGYDQSFLINFFLNKSKGKLKKSISSLKNTRITEDIEELINAVEEGTGIKIADEDYERFFNSILVSFFRTALHHFITPSETQLSKFRQIREFNIILDSVKKLYEKYNIDNYVEDSAFITINFIGLKINNFDAYPQNQLNNVDESYKTYTNLVINFLKELFSPSLNLDAEFQSMFALHLQRTFKKIELGIKIDNPLLQEIKHEYAFEFSIADRIAHFLE
jgi:transcriptional antiterminator